MSKIPLSYKIIKNCNVTCDQEDLSFIDTRVDMNTHERVLSLVPQEECEEDAIDIEEIKAAIHRELSIQIEKERLEILEMARKEAESLRIEAEKQGHEAGRMEGYQQGINEARREGITIKNNAIRIMEQAERHVSEYFIENRVKIIKLAADMAESIVHSTINTSTENIVLLIKPILQQYGKEEQIIITSHPDNIPYLKGNLHQMEELCPNARFIVLADNNLEKNGCIIENEHQIVDLQVKKQIDAILEEIKHLE